MVDRVKVPKHDKFDGPSKFTPTPEGTQQAVIVDLIDLGERVKSFPGKPLKPTPMVAIVWQVAEVNPAIGKRWEIAQDFAVSFYETANLRKWLEKLRGKPYTDAEADALEEVPNVVGVNALISVVHGVSKKGRTFGQVSAVVPLPRGMGKLERSADYERAPYWATRKAEYAAEVAAFKASLPPANEEPPPDESQSFDDFPESLKDGDEAPW